MSANELDHTFKVLLAGDIGVGKTSLLSRLVEHNYTGLHPHDPTIDIDIRTKSFELWGETVNLEIVSLIPAIRRSGNDQPIYWDVI